jgi:membrane associated rhomboid family serine protease
MHRDLNQEYDIHPPSPEKAREWMTVLSAAGMEYRVSRFMREWTIHVASGERVAVTEEIAAYEAANLGWPPATTHEEEFPEEHRTWAPGLAAVIPLVWYLWLGPYSANSPAMVAGANLSQGVMAGEWWRVITALTLHSGIVHLAGNLLCLVLAGTVVCRAFGGGVGLLAILASGAIGNLATVILFPSVVPSVGASTACFGAIGCLCAHRAVLHWRRYRRFFSIWNRTWVPIAAGLALLGMLGTGPNSDVAAHALGFLAGVLITIPLARIDTHRLPEWSQMGMQMIALLAILVAWQFAFFSVN